MYYKDYIGIIGSGIAGLSLGFELSRRGAKCIIIDSQSPERASSLGQGLMSLKGINTPREPLFKMKFESLARVRKWLQDLESYAGNRCSRIEGIYQPFRDENEYRNLSKRIYQDKFLGCYQVETLDPSRVKFHDDIQGSATDPYSGYLYYGGDYWYSCSEVLKNLEIAFTRSGGSIWNEKILKICSGASVQFESDCNRLVEFGKVVIAAGAGTEEICESSGFKIPMLKNVSGARLVSEFKFSGDIVLTRSTNSAVFHRNKIFMGSVDWKGTSRDLPDSTYVGQKMEEIAFSFGFSKDLVKNGRIDRGVRVSAKNRYPIVKPIANTECKVFLYTGLYKNGFQLAERCSSYLADLILLGKSQDKLMVKAQLLS